MIRRVFLTAALCAALFGQTKPSAAETDSFRLTMPKIRAALQAHVNVLEAAAADKALLQRLKQEHRKLEDEDTNGRNESNMVAERLIGNEPALAAAYLKAGITPKEAGMVMETMAGAMLGQAMAESGNVSMDKLPKGFVVDNLTFVKQNKDQIMAAMQELSGAAKKYEAVAREMEGKGEAEEDEDEKEQN